MKIRYRINRLIEKTGIFYTRAFARFLTEIERMLNISMAISGIRITRIIFFIVINPIIIILDHILDLLMILSHNKQVKKEDLETAALSDWDDTKPIKLYWIYDKNGWFLGGNPCPKDKMYHAEAHLKWCQEKSPGAYIEWEPGTYTYTESYVVARRKCEEVQRIQPGIRAMFNNAQLNKDLASITEIEDVQKVHLARVQDSTERANLGTNDQKKIDKYRSIKKRLK